jgi:putative alpha-1,2-mannosidase
MIGQYAHGNEPSHHIAYLYAFSDKPERGNELITQICNNFYNNTTTGMIGNDDCGQMSAWYIFSALGLYPMNPASGEYVFGFPLVKNASITLAGNKKLTIKVIQKSANKNGYIRSVLWNGKKLNQHYIQHSELIKGGTLTYKIQ